MSSPDGTAAAGGGGGTAGVKRGPEKENRGPEERRRKLEEDAPPPSPPTPPYVPPRSPALPNGWSLEGGGGGTEKLGEGGGGGEEGLLSVENLAERIYEAAVEAATRGDEETPAGPGEERAGESPFEEASQSLFDEEGGGGGVGENEEEGERPEGGEKKNEETAEEPNKNSKGRSRRNPAKGKAIGRGGKKKGRRSLNAKPVGRLQADTVHTARRTEGMEKDAAGASLPVMDRAKTGEPTFHMCMRACACACACMGGLTNGEIYIHRRLNIKNKQKIYI